MPFIAPDDAAVPYREARKRFRFAMSALAVSVAAVALSMAATLCFSRGLERADYMLFAIVAFCMAVLASMAVTAQRSMLARALRDERRRG